MALAVDQQSASIMGQQDASLNPTQMTFAFKLI
jgi:hypothetical protein